MNEYDFTNLNPNEFETLANDLLGNLYAVHIERFKPGKDLGIDGRFFCFKENDTTIIQCKHYATSGLKNLIHDLTKIELGKIEKLSPGKYIIATSVKLSPQDKEKIKNSLSPFIKSTSDIFGKEDLNALLRQFPNVEKAHYKLWIASSSVLSHFLNAKIYNASQNIIAGAYDKCKNYVITDSHSQAKDKINSTHTLVVTGDPGVGKTTLAEQLCLEFVADGYDFYAIANDIDEGFSVFSKDNKQVFYFDDFLGKNYIETLRFNEDSKIMQFINLISKSKNKKFVLTSRTNILDQGYRLGPSFTHEKIKNREYILDISRYSATDKAKILYSFLWRSDLNKDFLGRIIEDKEYLKIIHHRNYNPRLLEFITSSDHVNLSKPNSYLEFIENSLDNPSGIWKHPYIAQLDDSSRAVVDLIVFGNGNITEDSLRKAYHNFLNSGLQNSRTNISKDFDSTMSILSRSFVKKTYIIDINKKSDSTKHEEAIKYSPFNPSISDFIYSQYSKDYMHIADMILLYEGDEGVRFLEKSVLSNTELANNVAKIICEKKKNDHIFCNTIKYIRIGNLLDENSFHEIFKDFKIKQLGECISKISLISDEVLDFCYKFLSLPDMNHSEQDICDLFLTILDCDMQYYGILSMSSMLEAHIPQAFHDEIVEKYYIKVLDAWKYERLEDFASDNVEKFTTESSIQYEDGFDISYDIDEDKLAFLIAEDTAELYTPIEQSDVKDLLYYIDLESIVSSHYQNSSDDDRSGGHYSSGEQDIHGIFEGFLSAKFG